MEATLMEESQDIAGREDVQELRDMRTQGQFGSLVQCVHVEFLG